MRDILVISQPINVLEVFPVVGKSLSQQRLIFFELAHRQIENDCQKRLVGSAVSDGLTAAIERFCLKTQDFIFVQQFLKLQFEQSIQIKHKVRCQTRLNNHGRSVDVALPHVPAHRQVRQFIQQEQDGSLNQIITEGSVVESAAAGREKR